MRLERLDPVADVLAGERKDEERDRGAGGEVDGEHHRSEVDAVVGSDDGDGRQHWTCAWDEQRTETKAEPERPGVTVRLTARHPGEGAFDDVTDGWDDEADGHDAENDQSGVANEVLGQDAARSGGLIPPR